MSSCNIDHSVEDVKQKLADQQDHLPDDIYQECKKFLNGEQDQQSLNELFHLLKKYDLASEAEKTKRNEQMMKLIN
ncbi:hypothetical protein ACLIBG_05495 [Virgibacillus sp. W0181]|uniref:hypothetical protein n=1 Tax=Virgibacillus sp. W0181 TaxID=3391581 RepID=UPI003F48B7AB